MQTWSHGWLVLGAALVTEVFPEREAARAALARLDAN